MTLLKEKVAMLNLKQLLGNDIFCKNPNSAPWSTQVNVAMLPLFSRQSLDPIELKDVIP